MAWWWPESMILMLMLKVTDIVLYSIVYKYKFKIYIYIWTVICICAKVIKIEFKKDVSRAIHMLAL